MPLRESRTEYDDRKCLETSSYSIFASSNDLEVGESKFFSVFGSRNTVSRTSTRLLLDRHSRS